MIDLIKNLENPSNEYTALPFWFINGDLKDEEITRQILDFKDKGILGFVLHPRIGVPKEIPYLSDKFMHYMETAVKTAAQEGMYVVLYDEAMYPSGSAHGMIVERRPDLASVGIKLTEDPTEGKVIVDLEDGRYIVQKYSGGTIRGIHFGEDDGQPDAPKSADILNPEAVDLFIEITHERYYEVLKDYFGSTIIGFFTDEPSALGRNSKGLRAWTEGFEKEIVARGGDLKELAALFEKGHNKTTDIYKHAIIDREGEAYYGKLSKWCEEHGIALMGHPHTSDDIDVQKYFHIPGQDLVLRWIAPEGESLGGANSTMGKCSSDAARLMGRKRNSNECFGACCREKNPWYFTGGDLKWYTDWLAVRGVNMFIPHAFYYSIEGKRKEERPPDVGPNSIWWKHYRKISDYFRRLSYLLTDVKNYPQAAVLCDNQQLHPDLVREFYENQIEFNYLPMRYFDMCKDDGNGSVSIGDYSYRYILGDYGFKTSATKITGIADIKDRDIAVSPAASKLRTTHFVKDGSECWLFVNEGEEAVEAVVTLKKCYSETEDALAGYDVWNNEFYIMPSENKQTHFEFNLSLKRYESLLVIAGEKEELAGLEVKKEVCYLEAPEFKLVCEDEETVTKTYEGILNYNSETTSVSAGKAVLKVKAEEMVEYYINGEFAGFTMWAPHELDIKPFLKNGENSVKLVVTGNLANKYGNAKVPYGMEE